MYLFKVKNIEFYQEDFQDNIYEYYDIVDIVKELQSSLEVMEIECVDNNDCCNSGKKNYLIEIHGYITKEESFITKEEALKEYGKDEFESLGLFVIRVYKCVHCGKWIIDILE